MNLPINCGLLVSDTPDHCQSLCCECNNYTTKHLDTVRLKNVRNQNNENVNKFIDADRIRYRLV